MDKIKVASVQMEHCDGDKEYNLSVVEKFSRQAAAGGAAAVAFPECCISSYMYLEGLERPELESLADRVPGGASVDALRDIASSNKIHVLAGLLEIDPDEGNALYNTYVAAAPDGKITRYRKLHPFVHPELSAGSEYVLWELEGWKVTALICYDCNLWENWRIVELRGAQVVFAPHQTGGFDIPCAGMGKISPALWKNRNEDPEKVWKEIAGPKGLAWLKKWLPCRAYDSGAYVVFANGIGIDGPDEVRTGGSMIINPHGIVLAETCALDDAMVLAELDPAALELNLGRSHSTARRPELYGELAAGSSTATKQKRDEIRKKLGVKL
ncbi:nitrilase-related carbon-nitrogen hydrolase [Gemmatimonadota bacterium]